ncbi:MAG: hypothetical protein QM770_19810 [Tepidisphaeraceae bacterium]
MKFSNKLIVSSLALAAVSVFTSATQAAAWSSFVIRNGGPGSPAINDVTVGSTPAKEFVIAAGGQKAGWGTDLTSGATISSLQNIHVDRLDNTTRFTAGSGPAVAPYINIWVVDSSGDYAVLATEPSNAEWAPYRTAGTGGTFSYDISWNNLKNRTVKVFEYNPAAFSLPSGTTFTLNDFANYQIKAPTVAELTAGWTGLGTGAARAGHERRRRLQLRPGRLAQQLRLGRPGLRAGQRRRDRPGTDDDRGPGERRARRPASPPLSGTGRT